MIEQSELLDVQTGSGYTVGVLAQRHPDLDYLRPGVLVTQFEGVDAALDYVTENMKTAKRAKSSSERGRGDFNSFGSYEEAVTTFRSQPERINKFEEGELRVKDIHESGLDVEYDVTGDYIDMGRFMEGIPETFGTMKSGNARNRRISIIVDGSQVWNMSERDINHRAERILRLVDAVENGGARCEITFINSTHCAHVEVKVKHHDEPLSINDLAVVSHSEWLRRIVFRIDEYSKTFEDGYGRAYDFYQAVKPEMLEQDNHEEITIFIGGSLHDVDQNFDSIERLIEWELSKPIAEVSAVKLDREGIYFKDNGSRSSVEIQAEGKEILNG